MMETSLLSTMTESLAPLNSFSSSSSSEDDSSKGNAPLEYQLRQTGHNNQLFLSLDANDAACFAVRFRSKIAAMKSQPHISIEKILAGEEREVVSSIRFNSGPTSIPVSRISKSENYRR
jgi:hypothetical protein